jgi:hypothetical protein
MVMPLSPVVKDVISEVLETMFFVYVDFEGLNGPSFLQCCETAISLSDGRQELDLCFRFGEPFARMITANFLGTAEDLLQAEELQDCMKELANMVGGNYLRTVEGADWRLGIPRYCSVSAEDERDCWQLPLCHEGDRVGTVLCKARQLDPNSDQTPKRD